MTLFNRELPKKLKSIYAESPVTTAAATTGAAEVINTSGPAYCRISCFSGPIYLSTLTTAPTTINALKINSSQYFDVFAHNGYVSLYSTSTGGTREVVVFDIT